MKLITMVTTTMLAEPGRPGPELHRGVLQMQTSDGMLLKRMSDLQPRKFNPVVFELRHLFRVNIESATARRHILYFIQGSKMANHITRLIHHKTSFPAA